MRGGMSEITSLQNSKIKEAVKLRDRRQRDKTNLFLIEGYREISRALKGKRDIQHIFYCEDLFLGSNEDALLTEAYEAGAVLYEVPSLIFQKISYRDRPDGLLAIAPQVHMSLSELKLGKNPFLLIAEAIEKPGNLGSMLRSADAANVDALIICDRCTDVHNPNVVRSSVGTLFTVPVIETTSDEMIAYLKEHQIKLVATTPDTDLEYTDIDLTKPTAIAVGTEQLGLSAKWLECAAEKIKIPMLGAADSLNVTAAATLLLYEVLRQRRSLSR